ncbi:MAG: topoisomerase DNA-binding C4 zinc finger domain-containing protein, partial [Desulfobulbaceae bacterium]|nr:topoisomerase DNA-binding C4 zinc finger domain-containing protein [Desulfobulbaceae bacterium]
DVALKQFDQALMMHGKVLAKSKAPASIPQRSRKRLSKTIIKTPIVAEPEKSSFEKVEDKASLPAEVPEPEVVVQDAESPVSEEVGVEEAVLPEVVESVPEPVSEQEEAPIEEPEEVDVEESVSEPEPEPEVEEMVEVSVEEAQEVFDQPSGEGAPDVGGGTVPMGELVKVDGQVTKKDCPLCSRPMLLKKDRYGKFWSCSGFPACRHAESYQEREGMEMTCPVCNEKQVISKRTPTGRTFYVCPDQECEFMAWSKPHIQPCKVCNSPFLVEKQTVNGKTVLRCPRAGCNYMEPMPGDDGMDLVDARIQDDYEVNDAPVDDIGSPADVAPAPKKKKKVRVRRSVKGSSSASSGGRKKVRIVRRKS